jgi:hypothetical protein
LILNNYTRRSIRKEAIESRNAPLKRSTTLFL